MKPELMKNWFVVQNGRRIDIHVIDTAARRELVVVAGVRDEECANLMANAPEYKAALEALVNSAVRHRWHVNSDEPDTINAAMDVLQNMGVAGKGSAS
jgi:hypothetical protein